MKIKRVSEHWTRESVAADLDRYDEKAQREYMANLALEVGDEP